MMRTSLLAAAVILSATRAFAAELEQAPVQPRSALAPTAAAPLSAIEQIQLLRGAASLEPLTQAQIAMVWTMGPKALDAVKLHAAEQALASGHSGDEALAGEAGSAIEALARQAAGSASDAQKQEASKLVEKALGPQRRSAAAFQALQAGLQSGQGLRAALNSLFDGSAQGDESAVAGSISADRRRLTRAKRVENLEAMAKTDPELALSHIKFLVNDPEERSAEILISALRLLSPMAPDRTASLLSHVVADSNHYYLRREAAKMLGEMGPSLTADSKGEAVAALQKAALAEEAPARLMARDVLSRWGVDPGPELIPEVKKAEPEIIKTPEQIKAEEEEAARIKAEQERQAALAARPRWKKIYDGWLASFKAHPMPWTAGYALAIAAVFSLAMRSYWPIGMTVISLAALGGFMASRNSGPEIGPNSPSTQVHDALSGLFQGKFNTPAGANIEPVAVRPKDRFEDVAGVDEARLEIEELKDFLQHPEEFAFVGAQMPRGALLVGPPGTGKTLLARALAGEAGVPFYAQAGSDFVEQYVGVGASRVRVLFKKANEHAPAIIFIDEIDSIGGARGDQDNSEWVGTLTAMLTQLDGFDPTKGVLLIGATNRLDSLDPALRRRFDRVIYVGQPDVMGREAILQVHAKSRRMGPDVDLHKVARNTAGLSGSYLAKIVNEAATLTARAKRTVITQADFDEAIERITVGTKHSAIMSESDKKRLSRHEAGHQVLRLLLDGKASTVTMIPRGADGAAGYSRKEGDEQDRIGRTSAELLNDITISFGGRVAEEQAFGEGNFSTGVSADLAGATERARGMVEQMGMGKRTRFGAAAIGHDLSRQSESFKAKIDEDINDIKAEAYEKAKALLDEPANRAAVDRLEAALLERETLSGEQSAEIAGVKPLSK